MAKRKYRYEKMSQEELTALQKAFPKAVEEITVRRPVYSTIAKLLDCGVEVPNIRLIAADAPVTDAEESEDEAVPPQREEVPATVSDDGTAAVSAFQSNVRKNLTENK